MTPEELAQCTGASINRAAKELPYIEAAMLEYEINTPARQAAFLAQIGHECGGFLYPQELWGPTPAQTRYEGRADLGNTQPGDGRKFSGHGWIQITGRANHAKARDQMRAKFGDDVPDFEAEPLLLAQSKWAAMSAANFWQANGLNELADLGRFETVCRRVNGGLNGYPERLVLWEKAKAALT